jgi:secreted PhoX family phosphatase
MQNHDETPSNPGENRCFMEIVEATLSRRAFVQAGIGVAAVSFLGGKIEASQTIHYDATFLPFSFQGVPISRADKVCVPDNYQAVHLYPWGHPVNGKSPPFKPDATNSAADQTQQAGMGHDGMQWFPLPEDSKDQSDRGLLVMNHEYADQGLLFKDGFMGEMTEEKVRKSQAAHGVSVIKVERGAEGAWNVVPSPYSRRLTANSEMQMTGPAAGSHWTITNADPTGKKVLGTFNNCASGLTPWGTYLTCEENFPLVFGTVQPNFQPSNDQRRYGLTAKGFFVEIEENGTKKTVGVYRWWERDERFDLIKHPNESNRFGYVVEIDPTDPKSVPRKHTALGRIKHENAAVTVATDKRVVVYMGDDEKNEYIYKFVSAERYDENDRKANRDVLEQGALYVARFDSDGTGKWLELTHGKNGLTKENGFENQADICVRTRQAADRAGATMMDRPEWITVNPQTQEVFVTLTNNDRRGKLPASSNNPDGTSEAGKAQPPVDAANPRSVNVYGQIVRWTEAGGDSTATTFKWDHFLLAGDPEKDSQVSIRGDSFGSPDGLWFDPRGILWIQTDVSSKLLKDPQNENLGNNMMLAADPDTRQVRRFLTGPVGCEITGMVMTPDFKTMFVNIQHPGEPANDISDPANPTAESHWPDGPNAGRPRSATVAISHKDGKTIGM